MRTKAVSKQKAAVYLKRHEACYESMKFLAGDLDSFADAVALLAVHSAISLGDAVLVACKGLRSISEDHHDSCTLLRQLCRERKVPEAGLTHYSRLLARKTDISYGEKRWNAESDVKWAQDHAERFTVWALSSFREVQQ